MMETNAKNLSLKQKRINAQKFVEYWQNAEGSEDRESQQFWTDLCRDVLGMQNTTQEIDFERNVQGRKIDVFLENQGILIEQKSRGIDLDKPEMRQGRLETPYDQACDYMMRLPRSIKPYWIITCNFDEFRIYNMNEDDQKGSCISVKLSELPNCLYLFDIFIKKDHTRLYKEKELSIKAGEKVGKLYEMLAAEYKNLDTDKREQKSLNILIVRLVFLLYAEDAGLLNEKNLFLNYMKSIPANRFRTTLIELFKTVNTPEDERDPYLDENLNAFSYINGGLFADEDIIVPQFNDTMKTTLLLEASQEFDWKDISPTIFGAVFESTLNPDTRRCGGMHYTSVENIHKVIDPLFLDDLKHELEDIESIKIESKRNAQLRAFQKKLSEIKILDPAAGSHNFLTESYLSLRKLEIRIIEDIVGDQQIYVENPIMVKINQFYAIEINDFACEVGKTAMWIAEEQMMARTSELLPGHDFDMLPLKDVVNTHCANALRIDWNDVLPASECSYIIGNPPFIGAKLTTLGQREDKEFVFQSKKYGKLDYVACWYKKAADHCFDWFTKCAFVSTSSICQGEQASLLWKALFKKGLHINFAERAFIWDSEATTKAHVHCIVVGFSYCDECKTIVDSDKVIEASNINCYLANAENAFLCKRQKGICNNKEMTKGSQLIDGGHFIFENCKVVDEFVANNPCAKPYIYKYMNADSFLNNKEQKYCINLEKCPDEIIFSSVGLAEIVKNVREFRRSSKGVSTQKLQNTPKKFFISNMPSENSIMFPVVSSERRLYIPLGFNHEIVVYTNATNYVNDATLYDFGILTSQFHNAWMRVVAGRLKSDYRYSKDIVYNNFIWPGITKDNIKTPVEDAVSSEIKSKIENLAQRILDIRDSYSDASLSQLYDPDKMPFDLEQAHHDLDLAVEEAYGVNFNGDEEKIVAHLFKLYEEITK